MPQLAGLDHIYLSVSDLPRAEAFYEPLMVGLLGCRSNRFSLGGEPHVQYYHRDYGLVLRPARVARAHEPYAPGLHHLCFRVDSVAEVRAVADGLRVAGVNATPAQCWPDYAPDYWATYFTDPDGIRLEVTNFRQERRERLDAWELGCEGPEHPVCVVQRQLDAYNAHDLEAWLATYAEGATQYQHPATLLATGHAEIRARMQARFAEHDLHARLIRRTVAGPGLVIDEEEVSRRLPEGPARVALTAIYSVQGGLIQSASFVFGEPVLVAGEAARG